MTMNSQVICVFNFSTLFFQPNRIRRWFDLPHHDISARREGCGGRLAAEKYRGRNENGRPIRLQGDCQGASESGDFLGYLIVIATFVHLGDCNDSERARSLVLTHPTYSHESNQTKIQM